MTRTVTSILLLLALPGCAAVLKDPCQEAESHLSACLGSQPDESLADEGAEDEPSARRSPCVDRCIQRASCGELVDAFSGKPTEASSPFLGCTTACTAR